MILGEIHHTHIRTSVRTVHMYQLILAKNISMHVCTYSMRYNSIIGNNVHKGLLATRWGLEATVKVWASNYSWILLCPYLLQYP